MRAHGHRYEALRLVAYVRVSERVPVLPGDNSEWEPPESISNSEVKTFSADDSLGFPHAKVGHCQALIKKEGSVSRLSLFFVDFYIAVT